MEQQTEVNKTTTWSVGLKYGLISSAIGIVFFLGLALSGLNAFDNKWNWVSLVISIVILILAHKNFKDTGDGFMSYGQGIGIAFYLALVSVVISGIFTFFYAEVIDPATMEMFYDKQREGMEAQNMPDDQMEMAISWTKKLFWPIYVFFGIFFSILVALIVTIFTQKKNPEPTF